MKYRIFFFAFVFALAVLPVGVSAYFTIAQNASVLAKNVGLFAVQYQFGLKEDLYMPIFTERDLPHDANTGQVGYEILADAEDRTSIGEAQGIVLSDAEIRDDMYFVPGGAAATFTLVTFLVVPDGAPEMDLALRVTELPFYVGDDREHRKLNPSELQYYLTPEVELNEGNFTVTVSEPRVTFTVRER